MLTRTRKGAASAGSKARAAASGTGNLLFSRQALTPGRDTSLKECDIDVSLWTPGGQHSNCGSMRTCIANAQTSANLP